MSAGVCTFCGSPGYAAAVDHIESPSGGGHVIRACSSCQKLRGLTPLPTKADEAEKAIAAAKAGRRKT